MTTMGDFWFYITIGKDEVLYNEQYKNYNTK